MPKMVQIRNVPDELHTRLKIRAAERGVSLSDLLLEMAEREVSRPTIAELSRRIQARGDRRLKIDTAAIVRSLREESG
jgi:plasmid stability protein